MSKQVDKRVVDIINKVPDNYTLANEILKKLKNNSTKVKLDNDIKNSYYVFVNDTIYLASNKKANEDYSRLCLIAHECWHSIQSKLIQKINFILSNIELVLFIICAVILLLKLNYIIIPIIYTLVVLLSLLIRFVLEFGAIKNSVFVSKDYISEKFDNTSANLVASEFKKNIKKLLPVFILSLSASRFCRIALIWIIYVYIK